MSTIEIQMNFYHESFFLTHAKPTGDVFGSQPSWSACLQVESQEFSLLGTHYFYLFKIVFIWLLWVLVVACSNF